MLGIQQFRQPRACLKLPQKLQFQLTHHLKAKLTLSHAPLGFTGKVVGDATWSSDKIMTKYAAGIEAKQWTPIQLRVVTSHRSKCWHGCFQRGSTTNSPPTIHMSKDVVLDRNRGGLLWPLQAKKNLPAPDPLRSRQTWLPCNVRSFGTCSATCPPTRAAVPSPDTQAPTSASQPTHMRARQLVLERILAKARGRQPIQNFSYGTPLSLPPMRCPLI